MIATAQQAVLGGVLLFPKWLNQALHAGVTADWFEDANHRQLWRVIMNLHWENYAPDSIVVAERIRRDGLMGTLDLIFLHGLLEAAAPTSMSFGDCLRSMREGLNAQTRKNLWADGAKATEPAFERETVELIEKTFAEEIHGETIQGAAADFAAELACGVVPDLGLSTGLLDVDSHLGKLQQGELTIIAARTGVGKSSIARQIACRTAMEGRKTVFVSTEMGAREIAIAAARQITGIPWRRGSDLPKEMHAAFAETVGKIAVLSTLKFVRPETLSRLMATFAVLMDDEWPPQLFVVDYIQQINAEKQRGETDAAAIGRVSGALKAFALRHKVCVLAAAQLNRESIREGEPQLVHLRDSGALEQDADRVLMMRLATEDETARYATVDVFQRKNRNGAQESCKLTFDRWTTQFANHAPR